MPSHLEALRSHLMRGPQSAAQLSDQLGVSQPTVSRALSGLGQELVRVGAARSARYAVRDAERGLPDISVYRVDTQGAIHMLGTLVPVRSQGFVMREAGGATHHTDGLPWWLFDMRPQGYLGRAYAQRHGHLLGLPARLTDWSDTHALRALLAHGHDMVGNVLLGDLARERFLAQLAPEPLAVSDKAQAYARLSQEAARGDAPGSSAAGEQPKFMAYSQTAQGPCHVLVKFSEVPDGPVSQRWRDLLLAEHLALQTLCDGGVAASRTQVLDHGMQRFLEVQRFDREGALGRRGLISLAALDAEFVGAGPAENNWPRLADRLVQGRHVTGDASDTAKLLWAYGTLIGNTDMHNGNLTFVTETGRPYRLAPAYDMTPMAFAPRSGGGLPNAVPPAQFDAAVPGPLWRRAHDLAGKYLARLQAEPLLSVNFAPCVTALGQHMNHAAERIARIA